MSLVHNDSAGFLYVVCIGSPSPKTHENDALTAFEAKVHPSLEVDAKFGAHLQIGNDIPLTQHQ